MSVCCFSLHSFSLQLVKHFCKGPNAGREATRPVLRPTADHIVSVQYSYGAIKHVWKMTMTITRSPISLHSKVSHFHDCNNHSQNKITHSNRGHNMHRLRRGVTFAVCTEELVVSSGSRRSGTHTHTRTHQHARRYKRSTLTSRQYLENSNWD